MTIRVDPDDVPEQTGMPDIVMMSDLVGAVDLDDGELIDREPDDPGVERTAATDETPAMGAPVAPGGADPTTVNDEHGARIGSESVPEPTTAMSATEVQRARLDRADLRRTDQHPIGAPETLALDAAPAATVASDRSDYEAGGRARRRRWPFVLLAVVLVVVAAGAYYAISFWQVWSAGRTDQAQPVDAIVVMGAAQYDGSPSPQLAARLDHVVTLWGQDLAPLVVATGGNQPGDRFTEAEASAGYLVERGVPEGSIVLENSGTNSFDSLESVASLMEMRGLDEVLIVTDPYHALRSRLIAEEVGLTASVSPTPSSVVTDWSSVRRHVGEAAGVALGRVIGFERLSGLVS